MAKAYEGSESDEDLGYINKSQRRYEQAVQSSVGNEANKRNNVHRGNVKQHEEAKKQQRKSLERQKLQEKMLLEQQKHEKKQQEINQRIQMAKQNEMRLNKAKKSPKRVVRVEEEESVEMDLGEEDYVEIVNDDTIVDSGEDSDEFSESSLGSESESIIQRPKTAARPNKT